MNPEDRLLLGADLVKDHDVLHRAYNDGKGVTAQFNLNLLDRINVELGANFDRERFMHKAPFDHEQSRIEMQLVSQCDQSVFIADLDSTFIFKEGEVVRTEWSHKIYRGVGEGSCEQGGAEDRARVERFSRIFRGVFACD